MNTYVQIFEYSNTNTNNPVFGTTSLKCLEKVVSADVC